jgi:hypothetical protein
MLDLTKKHTEREAVPCTQYHTLAILKTRKIKKSMPNPRRGWRIFFAAGVIARYHRYHIEYNRREYEIVCPKYVFADKTSVTVIPWFLIPGRPYPLQVYIYACGIYSSSPEMGQRGAAKATRAKFKLETFSHSTVSRSFRSLERSQEQALDSRFGEEFKPCGRQRPTIVGAAAKAGAKRDAPGDAGKRFPSAADTAKRREGMASFLMAYLRPAKSEGIEAASRQFVKEWNEKAMRLLL